MGGESQGWTQDWVLISNVSRVGQGVFSSHQLHTGLGPKHVLRCKPFNQGPKATSVFTRLFITFIYLWVYGVRGQLFWAVLSLSPSGFWEFNSCLGTFTQQPIFLAHNHHFSVGYPSFFCLLFALFRSLTAADKASDHTDVVCGRPGCLNVQHEPEPLFVRPLTLRNDTAGINSKSLKPFLATVHPGRCSTTELHSQIPPWLLF